MPLEVAIINKDPTSTFDGMDLLFPTTACKLPSMRVLFDQVIITNTDIYGIKKVSILRER